MWTEADLAHLRARGVEDPEDDPVVFVSSADPAVPRICFQRVPEPKTGKNRLHLDINVTGEDGVHRLVDAGAEEIARHRAEHHAWVVLADPEGNEFCAVLVG